MKKQKEIGLEFIIDKLTNSIENVVTGDSFPTEISILTKQDIKLITEKTAGFSTGNQNLKILLKKFIS